MADNVKECVETERYDLIQATSILTADYLRLALSGQSRVLGPMDDGIESTRTSLGAARQLRKRVAAWLEYRAVSGYETRAYADNDWVLFYTVSDLRRISGLVGGLYNARHCPVASEVDTIPRETPQPMSEVQEPNSLVFVGGLAPFFNQDAVLFFCQQIFPLVLREIADAKFYIIGHNPPSHIRALEQPGQIIVVGGVPYDEVPSYVERAAVYVASVRAGTGLKTKMIEALKLGKAIVTTSVAVAGLWDLGDDVFQIHDDPESFAHEVVDLLQNDERRISLGIRARSLYERSYSFEAVVPRTLEVFDEIEKSRSIGARVP
jgi:glycosyltransferase involved in cell wall biosynthesis